MTTTYDRQPVIIHGKAQDFTDDEVEVLTDKMMEAHEQGNDEEFFRLGKIIPLHPTIAKAILNVYGKDYLLELGFDLTEAEHKWGKGWLNEKE